MCQCITLLIALLRFTYRTLHPFQESNSVDLANGQSCGTITESRLAHCHHPNSFWTLIYEPSVRHLPQATTNLLSVPTFFSPGHPIYGESYNEWSPVTGFFISMMLSRFIHGVAWTSFLFRASLYNMPLFLIGPL